MSKIVMVGAGYVGLVTGACLSEFGHEVICVDNNSQRVDALRSGEVPIYEPGLKELIAHNTEQGRLSFSTDLIGSISPTSDIFIAVGTPTKAHGRRADVSAVMAVAKQIAPALGDQNMVVLKSTVPVGTNAQVHGLLSEMRPDLSIHMASNPEFLREGSAISDFMHPDRVIVGGQSDLVTQRMNRIYRVLKLRDVPVLFTDWPTAELAKYAANAFLAMKVTYINQIADLCEATGANVQTVAKAMGMDNRIGGKFLHPGPGFGGSCFPKDTLALADIGHQHGAPQTLVQETIEINQARKSSIVRRLQNMVPFELKGKRICLLGLTFKPETDDIRDAPSLTVIDRLQELGAKISAYDPKGAEEVEAETGLVCAASWQEAVQGADAVVFLTEWNEFRGMDLDKMRELVEQPYVLDMRNIFAAQDMVEAGFSYRSVGR